MFFIIKKNHIKMKKIKMLKRPTSNGFWFYMIFLFYFQSVTGTAIKIKKRDETEKNFLN